MRVEVPGQAGFSIQVLWLWTHSAKDALLSISQVLRPGMTPMEPEPDVGLTLKTCYFKGGQVLILLLSPFPRPPFLFC